MDLSQHYEFEYTDNRLHSLEEALARAGVSLVEIMILARENTSKAAESLSSRLGKSTNECREYLDALRDITGKSFEALYLPPSRAYVSTGLPRVDHQLHGGCAVGHVTEIFGASGTGKSQLLLSIAVNSQELVNNAGSPLGCIYISTEAPLETRRLVHFSQPNTDWSNIAYIHCSDAETQDHIIFTQIRAKLSLAALCATPVGTVIIDSISHHLRASETYLNSIEFVRAHLVQQEDAFGNDASFLRLKAEFDALTGEFFKADRAYRARAAKQYYLLQLYKYLEYLARKYHVAVVLSNQVSDMVHSDADCRDVSSSERLDPLNYDFQVGTFSGWDAPAFLTMSEQDAPEKTYPAPQQSESFDFAGTSTQTPLNTAAQTPLPACKEPDFFSFHHNRRRRIPALGYTWSKMVRHRVLLWKTYVWEDLQPTKRHCAGPNNSQQNAPVPNSDASTGAPDASVNSKKTTTDASVRVRRFARVISSAAVHFGTAGDVSCAGNNVEFFVLHTGILEVT